MAFEQAVNKRGGVDRQPIHFVFQDDQTSPQVAVQLVTSLIAKGVPLILGPSISGTCRAVAPLVQKGPMVYCLSPGFQPPKDSYMFSASIATEDMIGVALRYFRDRGWRRIARLTTTDATGQLADTAFGSWLASAENKDLTVVADEHFGVADISTSAQMARIKSAQPQVLVVWATGTPLAAVLHAYGDSALDVPMFVTNSNMTTVQMKQYATILPREYYSAAPGFVIDVAPSRASKAKQDEYLTAMAAAKLSNDYVAGICWDPALISVSALQKLGVRSTAQNLHDYVERLTNFPGISGIYDFTQGNQRGLTSKDIMVMRYDRARQAWQTVSNFGGAPKR